MGGGESVQTARSPLRQADVSRRSPVDRLKSLQFHTVRWLLLSWINPTILRCDPATLGLDEGDRVAYVMPFKSIADLMVVDKACEDAGLPRPSEPIADIERRAFFFLARPEGRFGRKSGRRQSARMHRLFEHEAGGAGPVKVIPVSIFWGHQPDQEKSSFKFLFSDNWSATTRLKKFLAILLYPKHILVQFSPALELAPFVAEDTARELQVRKLMRILRVHFHGEKQAILGPDLSHRRTLINSIMESGTVTQAIAAEAASEKMPVHKIERKALGYANEIVSDQSYRVIRFFHVLLTWLWHKLYAGIDIHHVETVKQLARTHEIVYIPCHRSHIDYLLLSYALYHNGLTPPHVAAGKNLNLPIAGPLLRRGGAFFMRRSFQGDPLYKAVFDEYLHLMFVRGYSVEYFIEGGRSRTGRTLTPRTGMLSMTMRSFQRDASRPMALMPVYFSYERVIEAHTYMTELAGKDKKEESLFDIFRVFRAFKHSFGKVAVNFGSPVILADFLDENLPYWRSGHAQSEAFSRACVELSRVLATRINNAAVVNPVNLVATALLCTPRQTMEIARLRRQIELLRAVAAGVPDAMVSQLDAMEIIERAEQIAGIERTQSGVLQLVTASNDVTLLLSYYRNNTAHVFAMQSLIARIVRTFEEVELQHIINLCQVLYPYLRTEYFLTWSESEIPHLCESLVALMQSMELIVIEDTRISIAPPETEAFAGLSELSEIIQPTLERFFIVLTLLKAPAESLKVVEAAASATSHQLSAIYGLNTPEFFERSLFSTFIATLRERGVITAMENHIAIHDDFGKLEEATATTLDPTVRYNALHVVGKLAPAGG